ncbi:MAG: hypothetical protein HZC42_08760, partial [Candidatus Eisenbacteria bacterium]|nr:hypothetical protein [Candidatus Eisenbacteria bacterium]
MSAAGWKLRRLAAMGPAEAARRARIALRDRIAPPAYARLAPAAAFERLYDAGVEDVLRASRLAALVHAPADARAFAPALAAAEALARGRWSLFGHEVALADPPDWQANPLTGERWPDLPGRALDYRSADLAGGAKYAWEAGRLTMLPLLALSARLAGGAVGGDAGAGGAADGAAAAARGTAGDREFSARLPGSAAAGERALAWLADF